MSLFSRTALFLIKKFEILARLVTCAPKPNDLFSQALDKKEAPIIPLKEFFETKEEKERAIRCKEHPLEKAKDLDLSSSNMVPKEYTETRTARIYKETRHSMQNGYNNITYWHLQFENEMRFENPLIGWSSSSDAVSNVKLHFHSLAAAQEYCDKNGYDYYVDVPPKRDFVVKTYADNYSWNTRRRVSTK